MRIWSIPLVLFSLFTTILVAGCRLVDESGSPGEPVPAGSREAGTIIITVETDPSGQSGSFQFTGVPTGTVSTDGTLVVADLEPGTYASTEIDPATDFYLTAVSCNDDDSAGDPQTRTAVFNVNAGETVTCTFTNTRAGTAVVAGRTIPDGVGGTLQFTGVPSGTMSGSGTLVVTGLEPGTYTTTEVDPAPDFDLTAVSCDDGGSAMASGGDPQTRTAIFNIDPGEMVTCTFANARRGTLVVASQTDPAEAEGSFQFTGVPSGTVASGGTLVVSNLTPGTYTTTEVDPSPEFELTAVECDDEGSPTASSGDPSTRTAIFNLDPGETVRCLFVNSRPDVATTPNLAAGSGGSGGSGGISTGGGEGVNPFLNPSEALVDFPLPEELPPDAGTAAAPRPGPWTATNLAGSMDCGVTGLAIPAGPVESGTLEVLDGGATVIASGLAEGQGVAITMKAEPAITGRYTGAIQGQEQGVPVTINYFWQVVTPEYIVGFLSSTFTAEGVTCRLYRPFELNFTG